VLPTSLKPKNGAKLTGFANVPKQPAAPRVESEAGQGAGKTNGMIQYYAAACQPPKEKEGHRSGVRQ